MNCIIRNDLFTSLAAVWKFRCSRSLLDDCLCCCLFFCCFFRVDRARVLCYRERALVMILTLSFRPDGGAIGRRCLFVYKTIPSPDRWPGLMAWARFPFASAWCSLSLVFRSSCAVSHRTVIIFRSVRRSTVAAYFKFQHPSKYRIGTPVC